MTFIKVILPKRKNLVVGTIYRHPCMDVDEFNTQYLPKNLSRISKEIKQKDFVLMGDFNIDLLNYTADTKVAEFLDKMYSSSFLPQITHPTRINKTSQTLVDNIFSTIIADESKTGNSHPETMKYWVGVQRGQSYLMGRRCLFSLGWQPFQ